MAPTWFKLMLVVLLIVVLFGRGRIADLMGDFAKGIKNFKKGIGEDGESAGASASIAAAAPARLEAPGAGRQTLQAG